MTWHERLKGDSVGAATTLIEDQAQSLSAEGVYVSACDSSYPK